MLAAEPRWCKDFWRKRPGASKSGTVHDSAMVSQPCRVMFRSLDISVSLLGPSLVCMLWLGQTTDELEVSRSEILESERTKGSIGATKREATSSTTHRHTFYLLSTAPVEFFICVLLPFPVVTSGSPTMP